MSRVVNESMVGKEMGAKLMKLREEQQKILQSMAEEIKTLRGEMNSLDPSNPQLEGLRKLYRKKIEELNGGSERSLIGDSKCLAIG